MRAFTLLHYFMFDNSCSSTTTEEHNRLNEYTRYFASERDRMDIAGLYKHLERASITVEVQRFCEDRSVQLGKYEERGIKIKEVEIFGLGALVIYTIQVGRLRLAVKMLNVDSKADKDNGQVIYSRGGISILLKKSTDGTEFIAKRNRFTKKTVLLRSSNDGEQWIMPSSFEEVKAVVL